MLRIGVATDGLAKEGAEPRLGGASLTNLCKPMWSSQAELFSPFVSQSCYTRKHRHRQTHTDKQTHTHAHTHSKRLPAVRNLESICIVSHCCMNTATTYHLLLLYLAFARVNGCGADLLQGAL